MAVKSKLRFGVSALALTVALGGCQAIDAANTSIDAGVLEADAKIATLGEVQRGTVIRETAPYYGEAQTTALATVDPASPFPARLEARSALSVRLRQPSSIKTIAKAIQDAAGYPVRIRTRYPAADGQVFDIPISGTMRIDHRGGLSDLLETVASRFDLAWSFDGRAIRFDRMKTKSYPIGLPIHAGAFNTAVGATLSSGSSNRAASLTSSSTQDPWAELIQLANAIAPAPSVVIASKDTGRLTVTAPPSVQSQIRDLLDDFDDTYNARIGLEIAVLFVDATKTDDFALGLDLNVNLGDAALSVVGAGGANLAGNGVAGLSIGAGAFAGSGIDLRALSQNRNVVDSTFFSDVTQSGVVAPFVLSRTVNFVSDSSTTVVDGIAQTDIETSTLDTGVFIHALPRLVDKDRIHITASIMQSALVALDNFQAGDTIVQLPQVEERVTQKNIILAPGETLILSGYEQTLAERREDGVGDASFFGFGGGQFGQNKKIRLVVFMRPSIIPQRVAPQRVAKLGG